jgi:hypothetical protein
LEHNSQRVLEADSPSGRNPARYSPEGFVEFRVTFFSACSRPRKFSPFEQVWSSIKTRKIPSKTEGRTRGETPPRRLHYLLLDENAVNAEQNEFGRHSFVIKIWLEDGKGSPSHEKWRGHITYVNTEERRYVEQLAEISAFIEKHLVAAGAHIDEGNEKNEAGESGG